MYLAIISVIGLVILFLLSYFIGIKRGYYEKSKENFWFDKILHFLGGVFTAMFLSVFIHYPFFVVILVFFIGIFWELAEFLYGLWKLQRSGTTKYFTDSQDTLEDIFLDISGAIGWLIIFAKLIA